MKRIREAIDKVLVDRFAVRGVSRKEWERIKAKIIEACPGDDEIRAALRELGKSRDEGPAGIQIVSGSAHTWLMTWWCSPDGLADSIRELIPKPEPPIKEDARTMGDFIHDWTRDSHPARAAWARLHERLKQ